VGCRAGLVAVAKNVYMGHNIYCTVRVGHILGNEKLETFPVYLNDT